MSTPKLPPLFEHIQSEHKKYEQFLAQPVIDMQSYKMWQVALQMQRTAAQDFVKKQRGN